MIVQPNFLDHWKTRLLQSELSDDPLAPTYVLRLWGHCQEQKTHRFPRLSAGALAAICCYKGAQELFWMAMQNSGFVVVKNDVVEAHEWDTYNASLITSWKNGKRGGRPRKPTGYPRLTQVKPKPNPLETDREDKIEKRREDQSEATKAPIDAEFIYSLYPKKVGRDEALKAIRKAMLKAAPEVIAERTRAYYEATFKWPKQDTRFIPNPSTWYNQGRYNDDPATWERTQTNLSVNGRSFIQRDDYSGFDQQSGVATGP